MCDPTIKANIYRYIRIFEARNGYCPSIREIRSGNVGVSSISTISHYINQLVSEGELLRPRGQCRVILPHKNGVLTRIS